MHEKRPLILVTNDDGIAAKGISELLNMACQIGDVVAVVPNGPRSAQSNAITVDVPIYLDKVSETPNLALYKCSGTPTDCVKIAIDAITPRQPDLLISGINHGPNSAINVIYSGTMGAVFEGCTRGISSIGLSLCDHDEDADFSLAVPFFTQIVKNFIENPLPEGICLNVNAPKGEIRGVKICRQTKGFWTKEFEKRINPRGRTYFWMTGFFQNTEPNSYESDEWAIANGYIAITPAQVDTTNYAAIKLLTQQGYEEIR